MLKSLKIFALFLIVPFIYSCQTPAVAQDLSLKKEIAYAQVAKVKYTSRARKQQHDICKRLKKIQKKLEKKKKVKKRIGRK